MIGAQLGHYQVEEKLGEGGMGVVYKAKDVLLLRPVAIKILPPHLVSDEKNRLRLVREARAASALNHPNICTVYDIGEETGVNYIVIEFVEGKTLRQLLAERGAFPESEAIEVIVQVCAALAAAHEKKIVHRDIKPENIMVTPQGHVKVMDFGLAILLAGEGAQPQSSATESLPFSKNLLKTSASAFQGTATYMSPEQIEKKEIDGRTDIFSIGVLLYELLTGAPPFAGMDSVSVMKSILRDEPRPVTEMAPDISPNVCAAVLKALAKQPDARHADTAAMREALQKSSAIREKRGWRNRAGVPLILGTLVVLFLGIFFNDWLPPAERRPIPSLSHLEAIGLTSEMEHWPSFSPDGKQIVYTSKKMEANTDFANLWIKDLLSGRRRRVLLPDGFKQTGDIELPSWSPDGGWLAFANSGICIVDTSGRRAQRIVDFGASPKWAPDGKRIAFSSTYFRGKDGGTFVYDLEDSTFQQISPKNGRKFMQLDWSPDGRWLICSAAEGLRSELWLIETETGLANNLIKLGYWIQNPVWSPTGDVIYFVSDKSGFQDLWLIQLDLNTKGIEGEPIPITTSLNVGHMDIAPSEERMVFSTFKNKQRIWKVPLFVRSPQKAWKQAELLTDQMVILNLDISPDGSKLVMEEGNRQLRIISLADRSEFLLYPKKAFAPSWSPDGQWIAFDAGSGNEADIFRIPAAGGKPEKIIAHPDADWMPTYSPDGQQICFVSNRSGQFDLWVQNLETGRAIQITNTDGDVSRGSWSHSGDRIAYFQSHGVQNSVEINLIDFGTKTAAESIHSLNHEFDMWAKIIWRADDKAIYFSQEGRLFELTFESGNLEILLDKVKDGIRVGCFAVFAENLYFESTEGNSTLWLAEVTR